MNTEPPHGPYDQDRDPDDQFSRQLFVLVAAGTAATLIVLIVMMLLNGCVQDVERPPPTLPAVVTTTSLGVDHITVATSTTSTTVVG